MGTSLCWLALFAWTGDRRLFFPYAMQFAVQVSYITGRNWHRLLSGGGIVAVFLTIRLAQLATPGVLLVEFLVAAAILLSAWIARRIGVLDDRNRVVADALGSLVALAGLLL